MLRLEQARKLTPFTDRGGDRLHAHLYLNLFLINI